MKILICFGTRPEAIKMAPIYLELVKKNIPFKLCVTGQHREMLDQVLNFFGLKPDYDLNIMKVNQSLNMLSSRILSKMDEVFENENFDIVLVHGDTTTSSLVALSAFHRNIKVAHVEAGLRTYNKKSPFPEELNRQLTGRISDYHFAPTIKAKENLLREKVQESEIIVTGNTVIDALFVALQRIREGYTNETIKSLKSKIEFNRKLILVTGHRRESFGQGFESLCEALLKLAKDEEVQIIYPVHLNPNVKNVIHEKLSNVENIQLIEPIDYPAFVWLMNRSTLIISDSGGIQEEAPSLNIPVLVTRNTTERDEGISAQCSFLVGTDSKKIVEKAKEVLDCGFVLKGNNPYGDGNAAKRIVEFLNDFKH